MSNDYRLQKKKTDISQIVSISTELRYAAQDPSGGYHFNIDGYSFRL
jgi:hypothetical protein